jgi:hypothetical protein
MPVRLLGWERSVGGCFALLALSPTCRLAQVQVSPVRENLRMPDDGSKQAEQMDIQ